MTDVLRFYTIKDAAERVGVTDRAIRLAEEEGRIPPARRDELGARIYDQHELEHIAALMGRR